MRIRPLQRCDYRPVTEMLEQFGQETGIREMTTPYDPNHINQILIRAEFSQASWVAVNDQEIMGFILAHRYQDFWLPKITRMRELAWWVKPQYRGGTAAARLFRSYVESCELLRVTGRISSYTISKMSSSPDIDYERRGFRHCESTYQIGE